MRTAVLGGIINKRYYLKFMSPNKGFTIIELIVVIVIIAVLAAVVMSSVNGYIKNSKIAALKAELQTTYKIATDYFVTSGGSYYGFCNTKLDNIIDYMTNKLGVTSVSCKDHTGGGPSDCEIDTWSLVAFSSDLGTRCVDYTGVIVSGSGGSMDDSRCCCYGNAIEQNAHYTCP
jgi:prepilin-type N-terminal cleavage/methylation domain-containing protein